MLNNTPTLHAIPINNLAKVIGSIIQPPKLAFKRSSQRGDLDRVPVRTEGIESSVGAVGTGERVMVLSLVDQITPLAYGK